MGNSLGIEDIVIVVTASDWHLRTTALVAAEPTRYTPGGGGGGGGGGGAAVMSKHAYMWGHEGALLFKEYVPHYKAG